jgi:glutamate synthase domain-containing protein 1/glutamate synthase domain-containing protein 3
MGYRAPNLFLRSYGEYTVKMNRSSLYRKARKDMTPLAGAAKQEAEGGCGVVGLMSSVPVKGKHLYTASNQMRNRGNGKGGGIAAIGLVPDAVGVSSRVLNEDYILQMAYLDSSCRSEIESDLRKSFHFDHIQDIATIDDFRESGLEIKPPDVVRYFVRIREEAFDDFVAAKEIRELPHSDVEDELVFQSSYNLNKKYYASLGEKRAFVMSHAKNLVVFKMVGYAEQVIEYYKLQNFHAHGWIAHQRYPTKGRVWHPGGAHPFIGMHEALVHNGDFANYYGVCEYLKQHGLHPLFLTDTEVSVLLFDLLSRTYGYPLEWVIEAMAPTTERDFLQLPDERKQVYKALQLAHLNGSPDGPWFFIIARNDVKSGALQLLGITDTSMLRPQVFAVHGGEVQVGLVASEKQAIDAALESISGEDHRVCNTADLYWNARGGSHTDGGAFLFSVQPHKGQLNVTNKFGNPILLRDDAILPNPFNPVELPDDLGQLTSMLDLPQPLKPRKWIQAELQRSINRCLDRTVWMRITYDTKRRLQPPVNPQDRLVIDATGFAQEGNESLSLYIVRAYQLGWRRIIVYRCRGHRFIGCGLHSSTAGLTLHVYGSSGDYLASGLDGAEIYVHGNAQDQLGQIFQSGKLVVYGDVGQTFFYGAKGGEAFIMGNAAGRPLINAVGSPRVVINGTCLDYLGESFMAGDPLNGGGFVILNGIRWNEDAEVCDLPSPYPGGNLFSLASGGAVYVRDPKRLLQEDQLNGTVFDSCAEEDCNLILPYLKENERLFGIQIDRDLLRGKTPSEVYRKIRPVRTDALH